MNIEDRNISSLRPYRISMGYTVIMAIFLAFVICGTSYAKSNKITIGLFPFPENVAVVHIWKQLLEKKGYDVKISNASRPIVFSGVAGGSMDMALELWLPYTDKERYKRIKDRVTLTTPWFDKAWQGLAVPDYVKIKSIEGLKKNADKFSYHGKTLLYTAGPGAEVTKHAQKAVKAYDLPFKAVLSNESVSLAALSSAYQEKRPVVLTLWHPHWAWAKYKLHMLKDPKHIFTAPNHIYGFMHKGFAKKYPDVAKWLNNFHLTPSQTAILIQKFANSKMPDKTAKQWISNNKKIWKPWFSSNQK